MKRWLARAGLLAAAVLVAVLHTNPAASAIPVLTVALLSLARSEGRKLADQEWRASQRRVALKVRELLA